MTVEPIGPSLLKKDVAFSSKLLRGATQITTAIHVPYGHSSPFAKPPTDQCGLRRSRSPRRPTLSPNRLQCEHRAKNFFYSRLGCLGCGGIIAYMRADLHAWGLVRERLMCGGIDKDPGRLLPDGAMAHGLSASDYAGRYRTERVACDAVGYSVTCASWPVAFSLATYALHSATGL